MYVIDTYTLECQILLTHMPKAIVHECSEDATNGLTIVKFVDPRVYIPGLKPVLHY